MLKKILAIIEKETERKIDIKKSFLDNNFDSLDIISVIMGIEKSFKIKIADKDLEKIKRVEDLEKILKKINI